MKKFIITIVLALVASLTFTANAQVSYSKPEGKKYEVMGMPIGKLGIIHYFANDSYTMVVYANQDSVDSSMHVNLGKGKSQAVASLKAIKQMIEDCEDGGYVTIEGNKWHVTKHDNYCSASYFQKYNISGNYIDETYLNNLIAGLTNGTLKVY